MKIHRTVLTALLFTLSLSYYSFTQVIYSNSFKMTQDTEGWHGYSVFLSSGKASYVKNDQTGWIIRNSGNNENLKDVAMLDSVTAVAVGDGGSILKTTDAGETWRNTAPQVDCNPEITDCLMKWNRVVFYDEVNGIAAGKSRLLITSDGGEEWQFLNAPSGNDFLSIGKIGLYNIFVGDDSGYIYNSLDTGKTWIPEKVADSPILSIYPAKHNPIILDIYIFEAYALTSSSLFIKSGTESWKEWGPLGFFQGLGSGAFEGEFSENGTQFIVGVQGDFVPQSAIIRLRPPDSHWYSVGPPNEIGELRGLAIPDLFGIYDGPFPIPAIVYACGSNGKILKSSNSGDFWISQKTSTIHTLNSIHFFDRDHGFAVGDSGTILYTSTGGVSPDNNPPNPFSLVYPPDEDVRLVPRSITFMWEKSADPEEDPVEYTVLISDDSLTSWKTYGPSNDTLLQVQSPAQVPGRYYWMVVADDGMNPRTSSEIFTFTIYSLSNAEKDESNLPHEFSLHQNYPNPFNPTTKIKYKLPQESRVQLFIYNMIGEKVAELVNEFQKPGSYEVRFNGENFASGVYLYSLKAGNFSAIKKLILLK